MANIQPKNIIYRLIFETKDAVRAIKGVDTETKKLKSTTDTLQKSEKENQKAFVTAANKREQLIKEERQDLIELRKRRAQAYSVREIREYNNRIKETTQRIETLKGSTGKASKQFDLMGGVIGKLGGVLSTTFAVERIGAFVAEIVKLANQTRNVRNAFNQLAGATTILNQLRLATGNTVDDLTLMQAAVRADKFKIPLQQLASFFKFASDRAAETGQSVDYLVDSIVDGIGRKSSLVLDNLGISAVEIQEEFKKTGDFGQAAANIIEREMGKANVQVDEGARASARFQTALNNLKTELGDIIIEFTGANNIASQLADRFQDVADAIRLARKNSGDLADDSGLPKTVDDYVRAINSLGTRIGFLREQIQLANNNQLDIDLSLLDSYKRELRALVEVYNRYNAQLDLLQKNNKKAEDTTQDLKDETENLTKATEELTKAYEKGQAVFDGSLTPQDRDIQAATELQLTQLENLFKEGLISEEDYQSQRYNIQRNALVERSLLYDTESIEFAKLQGELLDLENDRKDAEVELYAQEVAAFKAKEDAKTKEAEEQARKREQIQRAAVDTFITLANSFFEYQNALYNQDLNNLQSQLDNKTITEQQFFAKQKQIKRDQAQAAKNAATFEAIINTAVAVTENLAVPVLAALAAVQGAAQVALIQAQPIPQFAEGVIGIKGPGTETSDSIPAMLSKGESVMTAKETRKHKDVFEAIRANSFDEFARKNYIEPALLNYTIKDGRERKKQEQAYNDYRLVRAVKGNGNVGVKNADDIGRSVAKHLSHRDWISKKFR